MTPEQLIRQFPEGVMIKWDEGYQRVEIIYNTAKNHYVCGESIPDAFDNFRDRYVLGKANAPEVEENIIVFNGCEHLDFSPNYAAKRQLTSAGLFWLRDRQPDMVQFCKKRGRQYGCDTCLSDGKKGCNDYKEVTHEIDVPKSEIES